ncbi:VOC family protein [Bradyrhizobium oropedii]|uniref:VOC family protein n=1 Tax=Bradyrhizobium oropedii TaxID=1571201 RepID=UPI001E3C9917|nr:hypothetical protein [Bradyrhizobium oropedii]
MALDRARAEEAEVLGEVRDMGAHGRVAHFKDPQQNTIQLFRLRPSSAANQLSG